MRGRHTVHAHEPGDPPRERLRLPRPGASNDAQRRVARRAHRDALILVQATEHLRVTCVICPCRHLILRGASRANATARAQGWVRSC